MPLNIVSRARRAMRILIGDEPTPDPEHVSLDINPSAVVRYGADGRYKEFPDTQPVSMDSPTVVIAAPLTVHSDGILTVTGAFGIAGTLTVHADGTLTVTGNVDPNVVTVDNYIWFQSVFTNPSTAGWFKQRMGPAGGTLIEPTGSITVATGISILTVVVSGIPSVLTQSPTVTHILDQQAASLVQRGLGVPGGALTITLPAVTLLYQYISLIMMNRIITVATTISTQTVTSTNLNGVAFNILIPTTLSNERILVASSTPLKSQAHSTATTLVFPSVANVNWEGQIWYFTAP